MKRKTNKAKEEAWSQTAHAPDGEQSNPETFCTSGQSVPNKGYPAKLQDFVGRGGSFRFTYGLNPEKLGVASSHLCDPNTAPAEFLLVKSQYHAETGRAVSRGALFFQTRQAFLPGEVTAEEANRLHASTLGAGFDPEDIKAVIAGERPLPELPEEPTVPPRRVNLIIDIQERMAQGKGPAYERWAKVYNLKQMAAALQYLQEHHLTDYAALTARTEAAVDHFHKLSDELRTTEEALSKTSELMAATVDYAKTRPVFDGYKAARYSKKYLAQHEAELATYRAAKDTMNTILNGAKLPKIEALKKSRRELAGQKKELYAEYGAAHRDFGTKCPEGGRVWEGPQQAFSRKKTEVTLSFTFPPFLSMLSSLGL